GGQPAGLRAGRRGSRPAPGLGMGRPARASLHQFGDRVLDGDGVHVELVGRVYARGRAGEHVHAVLVVQVLERAQVTQVEDRAKVHVEALGALAGEDPDTTAEVVHGRGGQLVVVRGGQRADVARRAGQVL